MNCAFDQGAHVTYPRPSGRHIGTKETMKDAARVLGRFYDAIEYRGFGQADAGVRVIFDVFLSGSGGNDGGGCTGPAERSEEKAFRQKPPVKDLDWSRTAET